MTIFFCLLLYIVYLSNIHVCCLQDSRFGSSSQDEAVGFGDDIHLNQANSSQSTASLYTEVKKKNLS